MSKKPKNRSRTILRQTTGRIMTLFLFACVVISFAGLIYLLQQNGSQHSALNTVGLQRTQIIQLQQKDETDKVDTALTFPTPRYLFQITHKQLNMTLEFSIHLRTVDQVEKKVLLSQEPLFRQLVNLYIHDHAHKNFGTSDHQKKMILDLSMMARQIWPKVVGDILLSDFSKKEEPKV